MIKPENWDDKVAASIAEVLYTKSILHPDQLCTHECCQVDSSVILRTESLFWFFKVGCWLSSSQNFFLGFIMSSKMQCKNVWELSSSVDSFLICSILLSSPFRAFNLTHFFLVRCIKSVLLMIQALKFYETSPSSIFTKTQSLDSTEQREKCLWANLVLAQYTLCFCT